MKNAYVGAFDLAEQRVVVLTRNEWEAFVADVREQMMEEHEVFSSMSDEELIECWNDEFFWNYV